jgi:hypothetical protein
MIQKNKLFGKDLLDYHRNDEYCFIKMLIKAALQFIYTSNERL